MAFEASGSTFPVMGRCNRCRVAFEVDSSAFSVMGRCERSRVAFLEYSITFPMWGSVNDTAWLLWPLVVPFP